MNKIFLLEEEIVPDSEFGTVRKPKGIPDGFDWVASDMGSYFLVLINDKDQDNFMIKNGLEISIDKTDVPFVSEEIKVKVLELIHKIKNNVINI